MRRMAAQTQGPASPGIGESAGRSETAEPASRSNSPAPSRLAAIIVYFRTHACLTLCLHGLRTQTSPPDEIIVIDNSSAADGLDKRPAPGEDWRWERAERNLGFGAACNVGAQIAQSDYLLFLNADVVLCDNACEQLRSAAESSPGAGVVGPRIYGADGVIELSARSFPTVATGLLGRSSLLTKALTRLRRTPSGVSAALGSSGRVDWISGACMLMPRAAFEHVGGFDEGYWMYWEDADICRRLKDRGWEAMLCTHARVRHSTGSSGQSERTIEAFHMSAARYYERHVARNAMTARLARGLLRARMRVMLHRHVRRVAS
jgi:N-acetylglucosaminyl-diphospho-decaprenol L-rhamnosyltransferase